MCLASEIIVLEKEVLFAFWYLFWRNQVNCDPVVLVLYFVNVNVVERLLLSGCALFY